MDEDFVAEASELLDTSEKALLCIESQEGDFGEHYKVIFRCFHSLKGAAGMFEIDDLQTLLHHLETALTGYENQEAIDEEMSAIFLDGVDLSREILDGQEVDVEGLLARLPKEGECPTPNVSSDEIEASAIDHGEVDECRSTKRLIYVVDDEPDLLRSYELILEDIESFDVKTFISGEAILQEMEKKLPDLILSDYKMPEMNGVELLKEIKNRKYDVPLIFISGFFDKATLLNAFELGASGYLEKPITPDAVISLMESVLAQKEAMKLVSKTIGFLYYVYPDLENFLIKSGKTSLVKKFQTQLKEILEQKDLIFKK